eukprot:4408802-Alexandrium_andersonii.AAC.1
MASRARSLSSAGPGAASECVPEAPEACERRPGGRAGGAFAELLERPTPWLLACQLPFGALLLQAG